MLKAERDCIRQNFVCLVRELPCHEVLAFLYQDGVFNERMMNEILELPFSERNFALLMLLQRRGPRAFTSFVKALKQAKREDLVQTLTLFESKFSELNLDAVQP
jgi:caspase 2